MIFRDRFDAAERLIPHLKQYKGNPKAVILAIPRGGLEIGSVLRDKLDLPLDIIVTKKIGAPDNPEYAIGVVGPDGEVDVRPGMGETGSVWNRYIRSESEALTGLIRKRYQDYRGDPAPPALHGKICIVVDDGIATGFTSLGAVHYLRRQKADKIILAIPVVARDSYEQLKSEADEMICPNVRDDFFAVGQFYDHFPQVTDVEAKKLLLGKNKKE